MPVTPDPPDEMEDAPAPPPPPTFAGTVRESPLGAVIGAFVAGFLLARLM
jgi:hypothetical protein